MSDRASAVGHAIAEELARCEVKLVASLPDNWLTGVIGAIDRDPRFVHVRVNREEAAVGLCSGAYMGALGSAALMGASGFMTVVYAITKINYTYEIPLFMLLTLRGAIGDHHKHHISNGLYFARCSTPSTCLMRSWARQPTLLRSLAATITRGPMRGRWPFC